MAGAQLSSIPGGKQPAPARRPRKKTLQQALAADDELAELKALRDLAAKKLTDPKTSPRDFAAISKQLREWGAQIAALSAGAASAEGDADDGDDVDDIDDSWTPPAR